MANAVLMKANSSLKFLYRKKEFLSEFSKELLLMSLVQCHIDYACSVWYNGLSQILKNKLQTTQNKIKNILITFLGYLLKKGFTI